jgi:hypothetical protein
MALTPELQSQAVHLPAHSKPLSFAMAALDI